MAYEILDDAPKGRYEVLDEPASVSAGKAINANVNSIPRQLGLTARYAIEGPAQALQVVTEPLRYFTDKLLPDRGGVSNLVTGQAAPPKSTPLGVQATKFADFLGLPSPETANERVIGDAAKMVAGAGALGGSAQMGAKLPGMVGTVMEGLAANPTQQLGAATGAGLAGGASREAGGSPLTQAGASLIGGIAGGLAPGAVQGVVNAGRRMLSPAMTPQQLDVQLSTILDKTGTDFSQLPGNVQQSLRTQLKDSLQAGRELDPAAVRRLADFATVGATPTRGMVSQNPVQITREQNLAKMAANSSDDSLSGLPLLQNQNNNVLISRLNDLGASRGVEPVTAGRVVNSSVLGQQEALRGAERAAWNEARNSPGYTQPIYPAGLNAINRALGDEGMMPFMNPTISRYMEAFQNGSQPFTPQAYRNLQSMLSNEMAAGGNAAAAAGIARRALESTPMQPITNVRGIDFGNLPSTAGQAAAMRAFDGQPAASIEAVNAARNATRAAYAFEDSSPLVRSVLSNGRSSDPQRIAQQFVIGGTADEARTVAEQVGPAGRAVIRDALINQIKQKALNGAADETGKISQAALNRAVNQIGDEKLRFFFSPEELSQLRAVGRVASYMQVQPVGSAVNNSNSGALVLGRGMDLLNGVAGKIPFGKTAVIDPLRNINISISQRQAQNVVPGLLAPVEKPPLGPSLLLPGAAVGGGLLSP